MYLHLNQSQTQTIRLYKTLEPAKDICRLTASLPKLRNLFLGLLNTYSSIVCMKVIRYLGVGEGCFKITGLREQMKQDWLHC